MNKIQIPGAFWVALVAAVVPSMQMVITQYFPEAQFWWSSAIVAALGALAKAVQVIAAKPPTVEPPPPGVAAAPMPPAESHKVKSWLFG